ncbi:Aldo/keto reductase [Fistulina hepatica ATCC 64428]|uniref:Aldo/keto reductase n=1 Tax=Fistulina hepatica ATCC 64428 TaxID=1128425 RepID=A0A0D7AA58_9AGAR|nr:Aldo/keto reductase [Fistulina hepatica ATCC 64428]
MSVPTYTLNDGNKAPSMSFGTGTAYLRREATDGILMAHKIGFRSIDTAHLYENEESVAAALVALGRPRSELYITTKLDINFQVGKGRTVRDCLLESLRKLGTDYVDCYLVHAPEPSFTVGTLPQLWKEMEAIKKEGLARSIGVSNFRVKDFEAFVHGADIMPAINQIEMHPYLYKVSKAVIEYCQSRGIVIASWGAQAPLVKNGPVTPVLETIAARLTASFGAPVSLGQVLTKWQLQKNILVVFTSTKEERIKEFLAVPQLPDLIDNEIAAIEEAGAKIHYRRGVHSLFPEEGDTPDQW